MRPLLRALAWTLGAGVVFVSAAAAGVAVHLNVPTVRRVALDQVNRALRSSFAGRVTVEGIGVLGPTRIEQMNARVDDPDGSVVLRLEDVGARVSTFALLRSALVGRGDITLEVPELSVARADVSLDTDVGGVLRIARAFTPPPASPSTGPSRGIRVSLRRVSVGHASVHGQMSGAPRIDADVDDLVGALLVTPETLAMDVSRARLAGTAWPGRAIARGVVEVHLTRPSPSGRDLGVSAIWTGTVGAIAESARVIYDGGEVDAALDVPEAKPPDARALWPDCPFTEVATAHVAAHGRLPELDVHARASVGRGRLVIDGPFTVDRDVHARVRLEATSIDAHALVASAPGSDLSASGDVSLVVRADGAVTGQTVLDVDRGTVGSTRVPGVAVRGELAYDPATASPTVATAAVAVREPGAPTDLTLRLVSNGRSLDLSFVGKTSIAEFADVPRLGWNARGHANARAVGTLDLHTDRLDAQVEATAGGIELGGARLQAATLKAHLRGELDSLRGDVDFRGDQLDAAPVRLSSLRARADFALDDGLTLRDVAASVEEDGQPATARASLVHVSSAELLVDDAVIYGLGAPLRATVRESPGALVVRARSAGLDIGRVARLARVQEITGGRLAIEVDASLRAKVSEGHVLLDLSGGRAAGWPEASAHIDATLDGRRVSGQAAANLGDVGSIDVKSSSLQIGGTEVVTLSSWKRVWGAVDVDAHVDLARLVARLPARTVPLQSIGGEMDVHAQFQRDSLADDTPDVDVTVSTKQLALVGPSASWQLNGVDGTVRVQVDGDTGATSVDAKFTDATGLLAALVAKSDAVPFARLLGGDENAFETIRTMPFAATLTVPDRDVDTLPAGLRTEEVHGRLEATVGWHGALVEPTVDVTADLRHGGTDVRVVALPNDLHLTAHYDGAHASAALQASKRSRQVLDASAELDARAADLLEGALRGARVPWKASARARLSSFPLQSIGALADRQVRGRASGDLSLEGLHDDAHAAIALTVDGLEIGDVACRAAHVGLTVGGRSLDASTRIEHDGGFGEAHLHLGTRWADAMEPTFDASQPVDASFSAKQLNLEVLEPFVYGLFTDLDGRVTGDVRVQIDPGAKTVKPQGTIALQEGAFQLAALGGDFHDASAKLTLTPDGVVRLENATARGLNGRLEAAATARFSGLAFGGARIRIQVPQKEPIPIVFDGVQLGMVDGRFDVAVDRSVDLRGLDVSIDVPTMHVTLPLADAHEVQPLDDINGVRVGIRRAPTEFEVVPLDGDKNGSAVPGAADRTPVRIAVTLGNDVEVKRGTSLDVHLDGNPTFTLSDEVRATGQVRFLSGTIDVQGKPFTIEKGTVTFVGDDPSDPQVVLTASWTASDGTIVYADFRGRLKSGKVTFRSDPPQSQNDILSLVLFGTTDTNTSTGGETASQASAAAGAAGGAATQPINRVLDSFGLAGGISTKIDTSTTTPRSEVELRIARDITFQIALVLGAPPPGSNPDTAMATLNWRFLRKWSLATTVGNMGSSIVDLIWQHRY
jgi:translocation and assembly module TamB